MTYSSHAINSFNKNTPIYRVFPLLFPWPWHLLQDVTMGTGFLSDKEAELRETTKETLCVIVDRRIRQHPGCSWHRGLGIVSHSHY